MSDLIDELKKAFPEAADSFEKLRPQQSGPYASLACSCGGTLGDAAPEFDASAAKGLSPAEVRKCWPRTIRPCLTCGAETIHYASWEHYFAGDW